MDELDLIKRLVVGVVAASSLLLIFVGCRAHRAWDEDFDRARRERHEDKVQP